MMELQQPSLSRTHGQDDVSLLLAEIDDLRAQIVALKQLADTDPMTGLANRRALEREVTRAIRFQDRHQTACVFALIDVDGLKAVNDRHGHLAGDASLRHLADHLLIGLRQTDIVARLAGDEFALILPHATVVQAHKRLTDVQRQLTARPLCVGSTPLYVRFSFGLTALRVGDSLHTLVGRADSQLYRARAVQRSAR